MATDQTGNVSGVALERPAVTQPADLPPVPSDTERKNEELRMLLFGFATGLSIAGIFLLYLVLEYANWLP